MSFKSTIIDPAPANTNRDIRYAYTVVTSDSYLDIKNTTPEFDSSYQDLKDANARATYLFFMHNPWGFDYQEMLSETIEKLQLSDGLLYYSITPEGLSTWSVTVVDSSI